MKKKLILSLRNLETKTKNKKVILNLPNGPLLKVKNDFEFFGCYSIYFSLDLLQSIKLPLKRSLHK